MTCNKMTNEIKIAKIHKEIIKKEIKRENMRRYDFHLTLKQLNNKIVPLIRLAR